MKAALRWIASSIPLMVLAVILSSLAWFVAVETENPTRTVLYPQPIRVTLSGVPSGMVLLGDFDEHVRIELRTTEVVWRALTADDFIASADLTGLGAGIHTVPIHVALDKTPSRVLSVEPESVTVELERSLERSVPVRIHIEGDPTLGYLRRASTVIPREVVVTGPKSYVAQAAEATAVVSVQDASADVEGEFPLRLQDAEGQLVSYISFSPAVVSVRVPIELSGYYRPLAVRVVLEGQVADDHRITDISVDPPTVTVFGAPDIISAIPGYIETEPVVVEGAQADIIERPQLVFPANVALVTGQQPVEVKVSVEAIQSSRTVEITPAVQGLGPGLTATIPLETVEVILSGAVPILQVLESDDVRVVLDLFGLAPGIHQIEPQVVVPEGVVAQNILPATMQVEVMVAATPTITPSLTTTSTLTPNPTE